MQKFEIRWSDLDPNRHLANYAFINFMSQARLNFLRTNGIDQNTLENYDLGPIAFYENIYYFKEVSPDSTVYLSVQLKGMAENGMFFEFQHNIYDENGRNLATCEMMGAWIDLKSRKLKAFPEDLLPNFNAMEKAADFKTLTKEDTRKHGLRPQDINPVSL